MLRSGSGFDKLRVVKDGLDEMFLYEKKKHKKDGHEYIVITGYQGTIRKLTVPGEIDGITVEEIGNHSFSGRDDLESVQLPESIKTVYGFAFHNCKSLKEISVYDGIIDYYDGVLRQCDSLKRINVTINGGRYEIIRNFLADVDRTLSFMIRIHEDDGSIEEALLTFPEFLYDFNENTMARTIQFSIGGSGYAYRECVDRTFINFREYDKLFEKAIIDGSAIAEDIALGRLLYPYKLADGYREKYEDYVSENFGSIFNRMIEETSEAEDELEYIGKLLDYRMSADKALFRDEHIEAGIKRAADAGKTLLCAVLVERSRKSGSDFEEFNLL